MSQRWLQTTKYIWCLLVLNAGPSWCPVQGVSVKPAAKIPSTIESQAKFFQYRNFPTHEDFDQGHRQGNERHFTERHEKARPSEGLFSAKVRWGDKKGGYGEHYWDLNHAGHNNDHHDNDDHYNDHSDDGSYHHDDEKSNIGAYEEPKDHSYPTYGNEEYDPEKESYEENGRIKRAHPRAKQEKRTHKDIYDDEESNTPKPKSRKIKEQYKETPSYKEERYSTEDDDNEEEDEEVYNKPRRFHQKQTQEDQSDHAQAKDKNNQFVLVVKEKDRNTQEQKPYSNNEQYPQQVPYESGAGLRQHRQPEVTAAASVPRLFLEPSTGHVVDRATGQAYVLQPIAQANNNYN